MITPTVMHMYVLNRTVCVYGVWSLLSAASHQGNDLFNVVADRGGLP